MEDLSKVIEMERDSFDDPYPSWLFRELMQQNPKGFRVAVLYEDVVGYCITSLDRQNEVATLNSIAVLPKWRRLGIGAKLVEDAIVCVRENPSHVTKMILQVASDNNSAQLLYAKFGFVKSFTIKEYYGKHKDGIQMELLLS